MKCWYLIDTICDRPPGICEGCERYEDWRKKCERMTEKLEKVNECQIDFLKSCPFCKGEVELRQEIDNRDETYAIHCMVCHMHFTKFVWRSYDRMDVIKEWNERVKE